MNDEEFERQVERLQMLRERWFRPLGLGWWEIEFKYVRTDFHVDGHPEPGTLAMSKCNWRYLHGTTYWNMPEVRATDDEELERAVVHEGVHYLLDEVTDCSTTEGEGHSERVATTLTKALLWTRAGALEENAMLETRVRSNGLPVGVS